MIRTIRRLWDHKDVIQQLTKKEVVGRYKGSYLGILWSFITPLIMLVVYTFVFSVVFESKWGTDNSSKVDFALVLFCGMLAFNIFAEVVTRSPQIIVSNTNYVKKIVFPLETFPIILLLSSLVHAGISTIILIVAVLVFKGIVSWTVLFIPIVLAPLSMIALGLAWVFASIGVFIRDLNQILGVVVTALMFLSPIFYPLSNVPDKFRWFYDFNPISYVVEDLRNVIIWGDLPNFSWLMMGAVIGAIVMFCGYYWFMKTKKAFSDVL